MNHERALESAWRIAEFKSQMVEDEGRTGNSIQDGLELKTNAGAGAAPPPTEEVDPGYADFVERHESAQESESQAWDVAAGATQELATRNARDALEIGDDHDVLRASLGLLATAPEQYGEFLEAYAEQEGDEAAQALAIAVHNTFGEIAASNKEIDFQQEMRQSEEANYEHVAMSLAELAARRGMSPEEVENVADKYRAATGQPLRYSLGAVMPEDRATFLNELAIATEVDEKAERMRQFKASFFDGSSGSSIEDGLVIRGQRAGGDLPPSIFDANYNRHLVEQQVRREDAERPERPSRQTADEIRGSIVAPAERDWEQGLTDVNGRPISYREIAEKDPDSMINVERRAEERAAMKWRSLTG